MALLIFPGTLGEPSAWFRRNPASPLAHAIYGLLHVVESAPGLFSQGEMDAGLAGSAVGFVNFTIVFWRRR